MTTIRSAIFIVGPTAVGKTDLAFKISKVIPSILISADSIQVYRGADIISGKDRSAYTYLLDILPPTESFSVRDFVANVRPLIEKAKKEKKIPIIVGGTGFYVDALLKKIDTLSIPPNKTLRKKLERLSLVKLQQKLKQINPKRFKNMNTSDIKNKRRLIRAIEIAYARGRTRETKPLFKKSEVLIIGLKTSSENLKKRIIDRVENRLKMGAINEAKKLFKNYERLSSQLKSASGYKELFDYLFGKISLEEAKERWVASDFQYAKRQMTWFKRNKNIIWFDPVRNSKERIFKEILSLIRDNLNISNGV